TDSDYPEEILNSLEDYDIDIKDFMPGHGKGAKLLLDFNKVSGLEQADGIILKGREIENGLVADIVIKEGTKIEDPIHLCFGVNKQTGVQEIFPRIIAEDNTEVTLQAHCSFPNAIGLTHKMFGHFYIGNNCKFAYNETHYHGENSGATVAPVAYIYVGEDSTFENTFNLTKGTPGKVKIMIDIYAMKNSVIKSEIKAFGKNRKDSVRIRDAVYLEGEKARSILKMKAAARDGGEVLMYGITEGNAPHCNGHVECSEIVLGKGSICRARPFIRATDPTSSVSHEASLGRFPQKWLDEIMAKGLTEQQATEILIEAMLGE
ncbi:MAG: SufD family Fe-S cluster assembly protein, partial [Candidatus Lokiarchaeota archaeon]|nr:SufD family Fe-S cluster assembly protein [Candidatus Lokiarchaeota archaeon]